MEIWGDKEFQVKREDAKCKGLAWVGLWVQRKRAGASAVRGDLAGAEVADISRPGCWSEAFGFYILHVGKPFEGFR